jgi:hypothetical protein
MYLAKLLVDSGKKIGYVASAPVYHIHDETWSKLKTRYEREAIALQQIMPQVQISLFDTAKFIIIGVIKDAKKARKLGVLSKEIKSIINFRFFQYYGAYLGNKNHRKLSQKMKLKYFYPRVTDMNVTENFNEITGDKNDK